MGDDELVGMIGRYLNPSPARDRLYRATAAAAFDYLLRWLWEHSEELPKYFVRSDISSSPAIPWRRIDPRARDRSHPLYHFSIIASPERRPGSGAAFIAVQDVFGEWEDNTYLIIYSMDFSRLARLYMEQSSSYYRRVRSVFEHEFVHLLDFLRAGKHAFEEIHESGSDAYFRSPLEFNAYYQQGFLRLQDTLNRLSGHPKAIKSALRAGRVSKEAVANKLGDAEHLLTWDMIRFNLTDFWHNEFIISLKSDPKSWRRFLKRLRMDFEEWAAENRPRINALWAILVEMDSAR